MAKLVLWIVMPVYNEAQWLPHVVEEWLPVFNACTPDFVLCILNDGSTDQTSSVMETLKSKHSQIQTIQKANSGHGQTCLEGYRLGLEAEAEWIFQIDSDGQCDPSDFQRFWVNRLHHPVQFGYRSHRADGWLRFLISRLVTGTTFLATGQWIPDANVPYRLISAERLRQVISHIPASLYLANIGVAVGLQQQGKIFWQPIGFRNRLGGNGSVKGLAFAKQGFRLFQELRHLSGF